MRIAFVCVNYGSDEAALAFVNSIVAAVQIAGTTETTVVVVDNTDRADSQDFFAELREIDHRVVAIKSPRNLGYFGGVHFGASEAGLYSSDLDYLVVSNVDLQLGESFVSTLGASTFDADVGLIAPSIRSAHRGTDINPKIRSRPTLLKIRFYEQVFSHHWLYRAYARLSELRNRWRRGRRANPRGASGDTLYAAHGSLMIFTKAYWEQGGDFDYPCFLFGEEIFVAEELHSRGLRTVYDPRLSVEDDDHVSTGRLSGSALAGLHASSMGYLKETYFTPRPK